MILLTVGTYPLAFDRLVKAVDAAVADGFIEEPVFAQIGPCSYRPKNMEYVQMLSKESFDSCLQKVSCIISHPGIGIITMALDNNKPLLVMPRLKKYGEVVNDHQVATAKYFEKQGQLLAVYDVKDLPVGIRKLKNFVPRERKANPEAVADRIRRFLNSLQRQHGIN